MKIQGLDGKTYAWIVSEHSAQIDKVSQFHEAARHLLKNLYPSDKISEEVSLPGTHPTLFADFVMPLRRLMIEVHGQQHYEFIPWFHGTKQEFFKGKQRDRLKKEWCDINNIHYIELPYMENLDEWRRRILNFGKEEV